MLTTSFLETQLFFNRMFVINLLVKVIKLGLVV